MLEVDAESYDGKNRSMWIQRSLLDLNVSNAAVLVEQIVELSLPDVHGQVADVNACGHGQGARSVEPPARSLCPGWLSEANGGERRASARLLLCYRLSSTDLLLLVLTLMSAN